MKIDPKLPIGKFAAEVPGAIAVFEALGIDYASLCDRSVDDAAHAAGIAPEIAVTGLRRLKAVSEGQSWSDRPLIELTRHLSQQHHHFVRHELGRLAARLTDVCSAGDDVLSELLSLRAAFSRMTEIVLPHFHREEAVLFREVEAMERAWQSGETVIAPPDFAGAMRQVTNEHAAISAHLRTMRDLRTDLEDADDLPPRCRAILDDVAALEAHLHEYMFLENWVLFPRAAALAFPGAVR
jgi:regulator of cell morphogenesis and NO signaling